MNKRLLQSLRLNEDLELQNKIVFAPITRCFADENLCATQDMSEYYVKRADAGLIISEATVVSKQAQGYPNQPGIFSKEHILSWQNINKEIHKKGAKSFCQLFHAGRVSHKNINGLIPVAPSKTSLNGRVPRTDFEYEEARKLSIEEINDVIEEFVIGAKNSIEAGFDGVEIHGANGYLLDQFLHQETNKRDDIYGGDFKKRARFVLELVDRVIAGIGKNRVGIRLSPHAYLHMSPTKGDKDTFTYLLKELEKRDLVYVHSGIFNDKEEVEYLGGKVSEFLRKNYNGKLMINGSYSPREANEFIENKKADLFSFGRAFIANSDLVSKIKSGKKLNEYHEELLQELS